MIKSNELRVGNYLLLDNTKIVKLLWVKLDKACVIEVGKEYPSVIVDLYRLSEIVLNEEILLKCGFSIQEGNKGKYYQHTESSAIRIWYYDSLYYNVGKHCYDKDTCIWISNTILLHHLQNLYFALTHEELEVNL